MTEPTSPPAARLRGPRWLDGRLVLGVLLLLVSVVVGANVVATADDTTPVYAVRRPLAQGVTLSGEDVRLVRARLLDGTAEQYVSGAGESPVGRVLGRALAAGELLPFDALLAPERLEPTRRVMVPVEALHSPASLGDGDLVDVFVTYGAEGRPTTTRALLRAVRVVSAPRAAGGISGGGGQTGVELTVTPEQAGVLVLALRSGRIDVVRVVPGATPGDVGDRPLSVQPDQLATQAAAGGATTTPGETGTPRETGTPGQPATDPAAPR